MTGQTVRTATPQDASRCFDIEARAYAADEAATFDKLTKRITDYPQGFLVLEEAGAVLGFINSGCTHRVDMSDLDLKNLVGHDPDAPNVVIMSVVIDPDHHGRGLSKPLMEAFIHHMTKAQKQTLHLMCKAQYIALYERFGFRYTKPSKAGLGRAEWHEMMREL